MMTLEEKQARFHKLIQLAALPQQLVERELKHAYIEKVVVHKQSNAWTLHFRLPHLITAHTYRQLTEQIRDRLRDIAHVRFVITYETAIPVAKLVKEYWADLCEQAGQSSVPVQNLLKQATCDVLNDELLLTFQTPTALEVARAKKVDAWVKNYFYCISGKRVPVALRVDEGAGDVQKQYDEQRRKEEQLLVEAALKQREATGKEERSTDSPAALKLGQDIKDEPVSIESITDEERRMTVQGEVFRVERRELKSGRTLLTFNLTDYTDSITVKIFLRNKEERAALDRLCDGQWVKVRGDVQYDTYARELVMLAIDMEPSEPLIEKRVDTAAEKRVEWHAHTSMSAMDALCSAEKLVERAAHWGHKAVAITDHGVVQAFPEAFNAAKKYGIKVLYGVEANVVSDSVPIVLNAESLPLKEAVYVVFDVETTGLSVEQHAIIELAGVKMVHGEVIDRFETFVNPHQPIPPHIQQLTNIREDMVQNAPELKQVLTDFRQFVGDAVLVAHNARFDMGFLNAGCEQVGLDPFTNPVLDTLELARFLYPSMKNHRLNTLAERFNVSLENHHRAVDDSEATGYILFHMLRDAIAQDITDLNEFNERTGLDLQNKRPFHCCIYAKNETGKKKICIN